MFGEHGLEPVRGLPAGLPEGEILLWQGGPSWRAAARRICHAPAVAFYFGLLLAWAALTTARDGGGTHEMAAAALRVVPLGAVAVILLLALAWGIAHTTVYSITNRRVVLRIGVALPKTLNLPFAAIAAANLRTFRDGTGDLSLALMPGFGIGYLLLWPHARPWRLVRAEPTLRGLRDAPAAAAVLGEALRAALGNAAARAVPTPVPPAASAAPAQVTRVKPPRWQPASAA